MFGMGTAEMMVVGVIALLLYGKRLPEVAKGLGQSFKQFKDGLAGFENEVKTPFRGVQQSITNAIHSDRHNTSASYTSSASDYEEAPPAATKFELPATSDQPS
jgi:sec-independent protein translocase protein TatA